MPRVNKYFKKFIFLLISSIIVAFVVSYSYSAYQNYQQEKKLMKLKIPKKILHHKKYGKMKD